MLQGYPHYILSFLVLESELLNINIIITVFVMLQLFCRMRTNQVASS